MANPDQQRMEMNKKAGIISRGGQDQYQNNKEMTPNNPLNAVLLPRSTLVATGAAQQLNRTWNPRSGPIKAVRDPGLIIEDNS